MLQITETAYPMLASFFTKKELAELFSPTAEEVDFAYQHNEELTTRLPLLTLLKTFQHLGLFSHVGQDPSGNS